MGLGYLSRKMVDTSLNKLQYLGTIDISKHISNKPCQYPSTDYCANDTLMERTVGT